MHSESLFCSICMQEYDLEERLPRVLPRCGHTVCTECLTDLLKDPESKCPLDKRQLSNSRADLEAFPINYALKRLIEENLEWEICKVHNERAKLACLTDDCKICAYCVLYGAHKGHIIKPLVEMSAEPKNKRKRLETSLKNVDIYLQEAENILEKTRSNIFTTIESRFEELLAMLQNKKSELTLEVEVFIKQEKQKLQYALGENSALKKNIIKKMEEYEMRKNDSAYEEELMAIFSQTDTQAQKEKFQALSQRLDEAVTNFDEAFNGIQDLLTFLEIPTESFSEGLSVLYPEEANKTFSSGILSLETLTALRYKATGDNLEILARNRSEKNVELRFEEWRNINSVKIVLDHCFLKDEDLKTLSYVWSRLGQITSVAISITYQEVVSSDTIQAVFSTIFSRPKELEEIDINLEGSKISESNIAFFWEKILPRTASLNSLKFNISGTNVTDKAFGSFRNNILTSLKDLQVLVLNLEKTKLSENMIVQTFPTGIPLKHLELSLSHTSISDKGLELFAREVLKPKKSLEELELWLSNTKVTDNSALPLLMGIPNVKKFKISFQSTKVSDKSVEALIKSKLHTLRNLDDFELHLENTLVSQKLRGQVEQIQEEFSK